ncbi:glycosyltransferase [Rhodobacteraceae bacterium D3-12]|nr:glycosyltransferase [Rhodobacteraceae bacterium D3-12]
MNSTPTIALFPEASFGAALNCVGIAQELRKQGARPVFICHPGFTGIFAEYGFMEYHLTSSEKHDSQSDEGRWEDFLNTHLPNFNLSPFDQIATYVAPTWDAIVDSAIGVEDSLRDILAQIRPDVVLLDNVIMFPAIARAGCPWVRVVSCAETEIPDPAVPPYLSGLDPDDTESCAAFHKAYRAAIRKSHRRYNAFRKKCGLAPLPDDIFLENSQSLNLLLAPSAVRYQRAAPLPADQFLFLEGCVRQESPFELPHFPAQSGPVVYTSFGSLGALDTTLIQHLINAFAHIPARFIVNAGGYFDSYDQVPDNVHLGDWFPQPSVVAQCDLFIHHGGNNSFCEALYHGVPSLVMPYCWDGHDNAQAAEASGVGKRVNRAAWTADSLHQDIMSLAQNTDMRARLAGISQTMQRHPGTEHAASAVMTLLSRSPSTAAPKGKPMSPFDNPFPPNDTDRHALWEAHMRVDIDAFIAADWDAVVDDFDTANFFAIDAGFSDDPADWTVGFPTLAAYRDTWLRSSAETREKADMQNLRHALFSGAKIKRIDFYPDHTAIMHKVFDGNLPLKDGTIEPYAWQSVFTLRKIAGSWKIISFVGYMGNQSAPTITAPQ